MSSHVAVAREGARAGANERNETMEAVARRLEKTLAHVLSAEDADSHSSLSSVATYQTDGAAPSSGGDTAPECKWQGWGYPGTEFRFNQDNHIYLSGTSYEMCGRAFPKFRPWLEQQVDGLDIDSTVAPQETPVVPVPIKNEAFLRAIEGHYAAASFEDIPRLNHAHGHTLADIFHVRYDMFARVPDIVIWPGEHRHVEAIVGAAKEHNVCIIPCGGCTSVSHALECPENEKRMIVSLDMRKMNRIKWIDRKSMMACIEAGAVGRQLEAKLAKMGLTIGHEPDSVEFSTLGGWVSTRASGMKKNVYGNIEDIVLHVKMVTPAGTLDKNSKCPRVSVGPDVNEIALGSEGTLGVITEVTVKIRNLPEQKVYGSVVFPDFESGVAFMHELAVKGYAPASVRLMDNTQFQFAQALQPEGESTFETLMSHVKRAYITKWHKFDIHKMVAATLVFEGEASTLALQQRRVYSVAANHGGVKAGGQGGERGYFLTFMIAYLRDFGMNYHFFSESFETSVPWANVLDLCNNVKERIRRSCEEKGMPYEPWISCRVTQTYHTGAAVYFYFGFIYRGVENPLQKFDEVEVDAREEILANGGSLSHHHGVGKLRKRFVQRELSSAGVAALRGIKQSLDPTNIFGNGNII